MIESPAAHIHTTYLYSDTFLRIARVAIELTSSRNNSPGPSRELSGGSLSLGLKGVSRKGVNSS